MTRDDGMLVDFFRSDRKTYLPLFGIICVCSIMAVSGWSQPEWLAGCLFAAIGVSVLWVSVVSLFRSRDDLKEGLEVMGLTDCSDFIPSQFGLTVRKYDAKKHIQVGDEVTIEIASGFMVARLTDEKGYFGSIDRDQFGPRTYTAFMMDRLWSRKKDRLEHPAAAIRLNTAYSGRVIEVSGNMVRCEVFRDRGRNFCLCPSISTQA